MVQRYFKSLLDTTVRLDFPVKKKDFRIESRLTSQNKIIHACREYEYMPGYKKSGYPTSGLKESISTKWLNKNELTISP